MRGMKAVFVVGLLAVGLCPNQTQAASFQAYDNTGSTRGGANGNIDIGHEFTVSGSGITVTSLGVYDDAAHTLLDSHAVTLFSISNFGVPGSVTPLVSVTIPAGQSSASDFVYGAISPTFLAPGRYSIIAYGLNSAGRDPYGDGGGLPNGVATPNVADDTFAGNRFDPYQFTTAGSPNFPAGGDSNNHSSASFLYNVGNTVATPEPASCLLLGLGALGVFARARRRVA